MKAYVIERAGGPEVLELRDMPSVPPKFDEVRIRVRAFGINRAEAYLRVGKLGPIDAPRVPGIEAVGEILEDPSGAFRVGERVATAMGGLQFTRAGSYAEEVTVLARNVVSLQGSALPWQELAALPQAYLTAWGALRKSLKIEAGQTLLVRGATSSVGLAAVTYAKASGVRVLASTRFREHVERLYLARADAVIVDDGAIAEQVLDTQRGGLDAAREIVGAATLRDTMKTVRPFGAITVIGMLGGPPVLEQFNFVADVPPAARLSFFPSQLFGTEALPLTTTPLKSLALDVENRRIPSPLAHAFGFDELQDAHRLIESNRALGKIVVRL